MSKPEVGQQLHAWYAPDNEYYPAEVVAVKKKGKACYQVSYRGYADSDTWVSLDELKCKALGLKGWSEPAPAGKKTKASEKKKANGEVSATPLLATHVGSLPRPAWMVPIVRGDEEPPADYAEKLHEATMAVMKKQLDIGLHEINDGELSRKDYVAEALSRMTGFGGVGQAAPAADLVEMKDFSKKLEGRKGLLTLTEKTEVKTASCTGPIEYTSEGMETLKAEISRVKKAAEELGIPLKRVFFTSPSPGTLATFFSNEFYATHEEFIEALAAAMKTEYHAIVEAGLKLQVDCPDLGMGRHTRFSKCTIPEFREAAKCHVKYLNGALQGLDKSRTRMHVCWGNYPGPHHHDIPLAEIADIVVTAYPQYISIEACNPGHAHEHEVWKSFKVPKDKVFMPGVVDTTTSHIEHPRLVAQRLEAYARTFGTKRVIACTDCGFGTAAGANNLTEDIVWQKMKTMVTGAKSVGKKAEKASVCWMLYDQPQGVVGA